MHRGILRSTSSIVIALLVACGSDGSSPDGATRGAPSSSGGGLYAACSSDSDCSGVLTCEQAFAGEPRFCTTPCGGSSECEDELGTDAYCQSTDSGGLCVLSCDVAGGCPAPSACRGVACQVF